LSKVKGSRNAVFYFAINMNSRYENIMQKNLKNENIERIIRKILFKRGKIKAKQLFIRLNDSEVFMNRTKIIGLTAGIAALLAGSAGAAEISQNAVISGMVTSVVEANVHVKEGQVLATVDSLVGPVPAARADSDGLVKKVLVTKGQQIGKSDTVVIIETE